MKAWMTKAWAWLQKNWKWLLFPVGIVLFVVGRYSRPPVVVHTDTTEAADARAALELVERNEALRDEQDRLIKLLSAVRAEHADKLKSLNTTQQQKALELLEDPEALNTWLKSL